MKLRQGLCLPVDKQTEQHSWSVAKILKPPVVGRWSMCMLLTGRLQVTIEPVLVSARPYTTTQLVRRISMSWSHLLEIILVKLLTTPPGQDTVLRALVQCGLLCSQSAKAFLFLLHSRLYLWEGFNLWSQGTEARFSFTIRLDSCVNTSDEWKANMCVCL